MDPADQDPEETQEWLEALQQVVDGRGTGAASLLMGRLEEKARQLNLRAPYAISDYVNTLSPEWDSRYVGDPAIELRIENINRWNAACIVARANIRSPGLGGHISTYASSATLYEVAFNHFFVGARGRTGQDLVYFQPHASPGIYARAFLEGRLSRQELDRFRRESPSGLSSYPHPRRMPEFWQLPTASMGLSLLNAVHQAHFNRYLGSRGVRGVDDRRVWCFVGDGEMDEPEATSSLSLAAREGLDNLTVVVNCNLQRLDGPVRGNTKIIQELESIFWGAGWNVIKVVWGSEWDNLFSATGGTALVARLNSLCDGDFQRLSVESGSYLRKRLFDEARLNGIASHLSDEELKFFRYGGHDRLKVHSGFLAATEHRGAPTVVLAKTVKGWMLGGDVEARNVTHQQKSLSKQGLQELRDRLGLPISDRQLEGKLPPYFHPGEHAPEASYLRSRRASLGGAVPVRHVPARSLNVPKSKTVYSELLEGSGEREISTTQAFVRLLRGLMRDEGLGPRVVPIVADEARTFGIESMFPEFGIYASGGQRYDPVDSHHLLSYRESESGQILEEGITEAGAMASFIASGSSYATLQYQTVPFYIFYSMFGFQRVGDLIWAAADQLCRGFLLGATYGRTTLNGEGVQHADGHSLLLAAANPAVRAYDPAFSFEVAAIIRDGLRMMLRDGEDVLYYLTLYNETYPHPPIPPGCHEKDIVSGLYRFREAPMQSDIRVQIFGSGALMSEALRAQRLLAEQFMVSADVWSATSYERLRANGLQVDDWNRQNPNLPKKTTFLESMLESAEGPIVAVTDSMSMVVDQISRWAPTRLIPLGTDGFGRSGTRSALRRLFGVDAESVAVSALSALADEGSIKPEIVSRAREDLLGESFEETEGGSPPIR